MILFNVDCRRCIVINECFTSLFLFCDEFGEMYVPLSEGMKVVSEFLPSFMFWYGAGSEENVDSLQVFKVDL